MINKFFFVFILFSNISSIYSGRYTYKDCNNNDESYVFVKTPNEYKIIKTNNIRVLRPEIIERVEIGLNHYNPTINPILIIDLIGIIFEEETREIDFQLIRNYVNKISTIKIEEIGYDLYWDRTT